MAEQVVNLWLGRHAFPESGMWRYSCALLTGLVELHRAGESPFSFRVFSPQNPSFRETVTSIVGGESAHFELRDQPDQTPFRLVNIVADNLTKLPDAVLSHGTSNGVPLRGGGLKVLTLHDLLQPQPVVPPESLRERLRVHYYRRKFRADASRWALVITDREGTAEEIRAKYQRPVTVVMPPLDPAFLVGDLEERETGMLLAFASLDSRKNIARVIEALSQCDDQVCLTVVCQSQEVELKVRRMASDWAVESRLKTRSRCSLEELRLLYARAQALVFPSLFEGFGYPVFEALSQRTVVITSRGLVDQPFLSDLSGLVTEVNPESSLEIAGAISQIINSVPSEHDRDEVARVVRKRLSPRTHARALVSLYREALSKGNTSVAAEQANRYSRPQ